MTKTKIEDLKIIMEYEKRRIRQLIARLAKEGQWGRIRKMADPTRYTSFTSAVAQEHLSSRKRA